MSTTATSLPASAIPVRHYRQILLFPAMLDWKREGEGDPLATLPSQWSELIRTLRQGAWQLADSLPQRNTPPGITDYSRYDPTYEEVVFFHPFARDLLYGDGSSDLHERAMLRFTRDDIKAMKVTLGTSDLPQRESSGSGSKRSEIGFLFDVPRVEAYLCKPAIVILAVEIVWRPTAEVGELTLADTLVLQSRVRELYPPFFVGDAPANPGNCPRHVAWLGSSSGDADEISASDFHLGREHFAKQVQTGAEPPMAAHWQYLFKPIKPFLKRDEDGPRFRQIIDDRLPGLTYLAVDDPRVISEGDLDRLTFCETGGDTAYPYSADFLGRDRARHRYERYWRATADHDSPRDDGLKLNTLYLCSGFQFVAVGSWENWYFRDLIRDHVRRHYFRLALIAHFQRTALLKFADEMSEAIKLLKGQSPREELDNSKFRHRIEHLQMTFLKFVSRAWFSEVSNQLQGQELFGWWSGLLGNQCLFEEVNQMNQAMHSVITEHETRKLSALNANFQLIAVVIALISLSFYVYSLLS